MTYKIKATIPRKSNNIIIDIFDDSDNNTLWVGCFSHKYFQKIKAPLDKVLSDARKNKWSHKILQDTLNETYIAHRLAEGA